MMPDFIRRSGRIDRLRSNNGSLNDMWGEAVFKEDIKQFGADGKKK